MTRNGSIKAQLLSTGVLVSAADVAIAKIHWKLATTYEAIVLDENLQPKSVLVSKPGAKPWPSVVAELKLESSRDFDVVEETAEILIRSHKQGKTPCWLKLCVGRDQTGKINRVYDLPHGRAPGGSTIRHELLRTF